MRQAHYSTSKSGQLIGGSVDNFEQSKVLSEYIQNYAKKKACYNSNLVRRQLYQKELVYRWFLNGFLISEKVQELEPLE